MLLKLGRHLANLLCDPSSEVLIKAIASSLIKSFLISPILYLVNAEYALSQQQSQVSADIGNEAVCVVDRVLLLQVVRRRGEQEVKLEYALLTGLSKGALIITRFLISLMPVRTTVLSCVKEAKSYAPLWHADMQLVAL